MHHLYFVQTKLLLFFAEKCSYMTIFYLSRRKKTPINLKYPKIFLSQNELKKRNINPIYSLISNSNFDKQKIKCFWKLLGIKITEKEKKFFTASILDHVMITRQKKKDIIISFDFVLAFMNSTSKKLTWGTSFTLLRWI